MLMKNGDQQSLTPEQFEREMFNEIAKEQQDENMCVSCGA